MAHRAFLQSSAPGGADHGKASWTRRCDHQLSDRHEFGGDPSQALVHSNPTGKFTVALSSIDLGQGMKSVTRQICAETLGVPVEDVMSTLPISIPARIAWARSPRAARIVSATR